MRLGLSSAAAPDAPLEELVAACVRRGLAALELTPAGTRESDEVLRHVTVARAASLEVSGLLCDASAYAHDLSALSRRAAVPIIVGGAAGLNKRIIFARSISAHGGSALVLTSGPAASWLGPMRDAAVGFAWQVDHTCSDPAADADTILGLAGNIPYVRLIGGGPEAALQEGRGLGALMTRIALAGFDGPLILAPSSQRYRIAWSAWLGRRGGWGCGSKAGAPERDLIPIQL